MAKHLFAVGGMILTAWLAPAHAQDYPSRPVHIVIGFGPGSAADLTARQLGGRMGQTLGQQFVVENRPGAGSNLAADFVARAAKDGHTLFMATVANAINPALPNQPYHFAKDLTPVALIANVPQMLVVHPSLGANNVQELIALAKAKPGQIHYASSGVGTLSHLSGELLYSMAGAKLVHVPYPGSAQGIADVLAGRVGVMFSPASTVLPQVRAGKLKALAVTQPKRAAMAPEVPSMAEAGLPGYDASIWIGLTAPAGTPRPVIDKLAHAANDALKVSEVVAPLRAQGIEPLVGGPDEFARYIAGEIKKWQALVPPRQ